MRVPLPTCLLLLPLCAAWTVHAQGENQLPREPVFTDRAAEQRGDVIRDSAGTPYVVERDAHGNVLGIRRGDAPPGSSTREAERRGYPGRPYFEGAPIAPGVYLPRDYSGRFRSLGNWRRHDLQPPGPGQEWVRIGDDLVLVDRRTGLVRQVVPRR